VLELLEGRLAPATLGGAHAPIVIRSDADFLSSNCVISGNGSVSSPYIIGPWSINGGTGDAVFIDGTNLTKSFVLYDLTIAGTSAPAGRGIVLSNINLPGQTPILAKVSGAQTSIQHGGVGILVTNSNNVTLDGGGANPKGPGVSQAAGTINQNASGAIDVENSSHVTVTGWQFSANGVDGQPDWVAFDPSLSRWGVGGVRFFCVTDSVIDHNAANNCTSNSYSLFDSCGNTVTDNTSDYPFTMNFLVTDGSSYNTLSGNVAGTADFINMMVADPLPGTWTLTKYGASHDNVLSGNVAHSSGPTGEERKANVSPAFLGGVVVLNGTYDNTIENNQVWGSVGSDLAWAQAVPSAARRSGWSPSRPCSTATSPPPKAAGASKTSTAMSGRATPPSSSTPASRPRAPAPPPWLAWAQPPRPPSASARRRAASSPRWTPRPSRMAPGNSSTAGSRRPSPRWPSATRPPASGR
jgi:hypothetical protein